MPLDCGQKLILDYIPKYITAPGSHVTIEPREKPPLATSAPNSSPIDIKKRVKTKTQAAKESSAIVLATHLLRYARAANRGVPNWQFLVRDLKREPNCAKRNR